MPMPASTASPCSLVAQLGRLLVGPDHQWTKSVVFQSSLELHSLCFGPHNACLQVPAGLSPPPARGFADKSWDAIKPARTKLKLYRWAEQPDAADLSKAPRLQLLLHSPSWSCFSSYKERFKMTGSGKIRAMRPGHRHKRFVKSNNQNRALRKTKLVHCAYAQTMKKLGFSMRSFA